MKESNFNEKIGQTFHICFAYGQDRGACVGGAPATNQVSKVVFDLFPFVFSIFNCC